MVDFAINCTKRYCLNKFMGSGYKPEPAGGILESDRLIPFVICGEPVKGKNRVISEPKNQVDVAPTIAGILGFTMPEADGKNILAPQ